MTHPIDYKKIEEYRILIKDLFNYDEKIILMNLVNAELSEERWQGK
jgi:hypothetical protein